MSGVAVTLAWASASARGSPAARACSMWTSVISPARGISVMRTAVGRWDINSGVQPAQACALGPRPGGCGGQ